MSERRADRVRGPGHDTFWGHCAAGQLSLPRCGDCGEITWPVEPDCDHCSSANLHWERMSGEGRVVSWCQFHQDYYRGHPPLPHDSILVELAEGVLFLSEPLGFAYDEIAMDMPVRLAFLDCEDSGGAFRLPVFARA